MGASITKYCLEQITDYLVFEDLCTDLMVRNGYERIEPLGGFKDKGRDAVHYSSNDGTTTIFAYSVREDWRAKLSEDAGKIKKHGHTCNEFVFICTAEFTAGERDHALIDIENEFGCRLELYGLDRLRVQLENTHPDLIKRYPQIFPPGFNILEFESKTIIETVVLFHSSEDAAFTEWLSRRLMYEGYSVLAKDIPIEQKSWPEDIENFIQENAAAIILIMSNHALTNHDFIGSASSFISLTKNRTPNPIITITTEEFQSNHLPKFVSQIEPIPFQDKWSSGLIETLKRLKSLQCPKPNEKNRKIATKDLVKESRLSISSETLFSNCFSIIQLPSKVYGFILSKSCNKRKVQDWDHTWAFRQASSNLYFSFEDPPIRIASQLGPYGRVPYKWEALDNIEGIPTENLISELIRKSIEVQFKLLGLEYCTESRLLYFSEKSEEFASLKFVNPVTKKSSHVKGFGRRKYWKPSGEEYYRYQLAPTVRVVRNLFEDFCIIMRLIVRFTDDEGTLLVDSKKVSRRKHLCKSWWNHHWGNRILAVSQFLADEGQIHIGSDNNPLILEKFPISVVSPIGINEDKFSDLEEREELAYSHDEHEE